MISDKGHGNAPGVRSTKGCWTCRVRRKKCDETSPSCQTCASLGIACHGFGPRPFWMDRGPREREEADRIKIVIAKGGHRRRKSRSNVAQPSVQPDGQGLSSQICRLSGNDADIRADTTVSNKRAISPSDIVVESSIRLSHASELDFQAQPSEIFAATDAWPSHNSMRETISLNTDHSIELPLDFIIDWSPPTDHFSVEDWILSKASAQSNNICHSTEKSDKSFQNFSDPSNCPLDTASVDIIAPAPFSVEHSALISYYLDNVILERLVFQSTEGSGSQQWLHFLLLSSSQVLETAMSLSRAHAEAITCPKYAEDMANYSSDMCRAIALLKTLPSAVATLSLLDEKRKVSEALTACACFLHVIRLELLYGGGSWWKHCLDQAASYIQTLIDVAISDSPCTAPGIRQISCHSLQATASKALLSHLLWLDIQANVSSGTGLSLGINPQHLLHSSCIDILEVSGCQNWLAEELCQICHLRDWKTQQETQQQLSIIELAIRGGTILKRLSTKVSDLNDRGRSGEECSEGNDTCGLRTHETPERTVSEDVTLAYAHAAIIFLHVVISGPNPYLEELRKITPSLTNCLGHLNRRGKLRLVPWPLCVAACFADEEQYELLLANISSPKERTSILEQVHSRVCSEALSIAQKCRSARRRGEFWNWVQVMQHIDKSLLLA